MPPTAITLNQTRLILDPRGALYWPDRDLLAVADLHFEKGSHFATMGVPLPPHDTARTLDAVAALLAHAIQKPLASRATKCLAEAPQEVSKV